MQLGAHLLRNYGQGDIPLIAPSAMPSTAELTALLAEELKLAEASLRQQAALQEAEVAEPDFELKVRSLHGSLPPRMQEVVAHSRKKPRDLGDPTLVALSKRSGVDLELLADIKVAFNATNPRGREGVDEDEFIACFGPSMCPGLTTDERRLWFRMIDNDCNGTISWTEVASYLSDIKSTQATEQYFSDYTVEATGPKVCQRPHRQPITKLLVSKSLDTIYSMSPDGLVHGWSPSTLRSLPLPIHATGSTPVDITLCPHNNRIIVLQADSSIFVYDAFLGGDQTLKHELWRGFASPEKAVVRTMYDGSAYYENTSPHQRSRFVTDAVIPVSLITLPHSNLRCIDQLGGHTYGEPVVVGDEAGVLSGYLLTLGSQKSLTSTFTAKVHVGWCTAVKYVSSMSAILSSGLDGALCLTEVEGGHIVIKMKLDPAKSKPLYGFAFHEPSLMAATWGARSVHVWNTLTGARITTLADHDHPVIAAALGEDRNVLFALQNNKTVRVWDLRTWRSLGAVEDPNLRQPSNHLAAIVWSDKEKQLVSGCADLFGWRPASFQKQLDAGFTLEQAPHLTKAAGHLYPIRDAHFVASTHHATSIDAQRVIVWDSLSRQLLTSWDWDEDNVITASMFDPNGLRLYAGTERGDVFAINYSNGYVIRRFKYQGPRANVVAILVCKGVLEESPNMMLASIPPFLYQWFVNDEHVAPSNVIEMDVKREGFVTAICEASSEKKVLAYAQSQGRVTLVNYSLFPLATVELGNCGIESLASIMPGLFVALCADGCARFIAVSNDGYMMQSIVTLQAAHTQGEAVTCAAFSLTDMVAVFGDSEGNMCAFRCKRLLDQRYARKELLAKMRFDPKPVAACNHFIDMMWSRRCHPARVVSCGIDGAFALSAAQDKMLWAWNLSNGTDIGPYGNLPEPAFASDSDATQLADSTLRKSSSSATNRDTFKSHAYNVDHDVTVSDRDKVAQTTRRMSMASALSALNAPLPPLVVADNSGSSGGKQTMKNVSLKLPPVLNAIDNPMKRARCFNLVTDHVMKLRTDLVREIPMGEQLHRCLQEVARMRESHGGDAEGADGTEPRRAFMDLWLPKVPKRIADDDSGTSGLRGLGRRGGRRSKSSLS